MVPVQEAAPLAQISQGHPPPQALCPHGPWRVREPSSFRVKVMLPWIPPSLPFSHVYSDLLLT